ncbi:hypothetical protein H6G00_02020 [Leptolyngbya sp. FACHB-541]|uniref:hypothetical protein n=1 Tax=Leptolyngbya sp. FACHB-541 TaxID=2692810 RepID=UPI0016871DA7|nr:hypothetical protein [Leptolyngbya sp. FACHB-541]MBD1995409.1 hypothetical protein [Leptolyngbya sp. FACHB-541]
MATRAQMIAAWQNYMKSVQPTITTRRGGQVLQIRTRDGVSQIARSVGSSSARSVRMR